VTESNRPGSGRRIFPRHAADLDVRVDTSPRTVGRPVRFLNYGPPGDAPWARVLATVGFVAGGALLVWSGYIHFHLWKGGDYRDIPTIGPLFLLQSVVGLVLGLTVAAVHRVWAAILGVGFAASTMAGFFISVEHGLFGFKDSSSAPFAHLALIIEIAAVVVLLVAGAVCLVGTAATTSTGTTSPTSPSTDP
jgi:hypothetical protein